MLKRFFPLVFGAALIMLMLPITASADNNSNHIYVCGEKMPTSGIKYWLCDSGDITEANASASNYNVKYEADINTITLKNATLSVLGGDVYYQQYYAVIQNFRTWDSMNIVLEGSSTVSAPSDADKQYIYGILSMGKLFISGSGSLTVTGTNAVGTKPSYGIYCESDITFSGTGTLTANGGPSEYASSGIYIDSSVLSPGESATNGNLIVSGRGTLNCNSGALAATSSDSHSYGAFVSGSITVSAGGTLTGTAKAVNGAWGDSIGIRSEAGNIEVSVGATLIGTGDTVSTRALGDVSSGVYASRGNITITNATLRGISKAAHESYGVYAAEGTVAVSGASALLEGTSGEASTTDTQQCISSGVCAKDFTVTGGTVEGTAGNTDKAVGRWTISNSYGIYAKGNINAGGTAQITGQAGVVEGQYGSASCGIRSKGGLEIAGKAVVNGAGNGSESFSYGISAGSITLRSGTLAASGNRSALDKAPALPSNYEWRTVSDSAFIQSSTEKYVWAAAHTYLEIYAPEPLPYTGGSGGPSGKYSDDRLVKVITADRNKDVEITALSPGDAGYDLLVRGQNGKPIMSYEITRADNAKKGAWVMFFVGLDNIGKEFTVLHRLADGSTEVFHTVCAANGWITAKVDELSPFMVFEGTVNISGAAARGTSDSNPDTGARDHVGIAYALAAVSVLCDAACQSSKRSGDSRRRDIR